MPPPSSISRVRSSASRRASSLPRPRLDGGGAPSPSVADDEPATKKPPKPLDLATIPRPPLRLAAGLAAVGCVESSYLAFEKLTGGAVTCPLTGCQTALSSGYSVLFGVPLSAYGAAAYGLVAALAWWGAGMADAVFDVEDAGDDASALASPERRSTADAYSKARALLCFSGFGLAGVSSYLLYVLAVPLGGAGAPPLPHLRRAFLLDLRHRLVRARPQASRVDGAGGGGAVRGDGAVVLRRDRGRRGEGRGEGERS